LREFEGMRVKHFGKATDEDFAEEGCAIEWWYLQAASRTTAPFPNYAFEGDVKRQKLCSQTNIMV
jgi:hypothetical protein